MGYVGFPLAYQFSKFFKSFDFKAFFFDGT